MTRSNLEMKAAVLLSLGALFVPPQAMVAQQAVAFTRITVVDVAEGRLRPDQTVIIAGNRIQAVGPSADTRIPSGARVIDAQGKFVIPGLWDMHAHLLNLKASGYIHYAAFITQGVTGIREMGAMHLDSTLRWRREFAAGTKVGPRVLTAGPSVAYREEAGAGGWQVYVHTPDDGRRVVDSLKRAGADFLKIYPSFGTTMPREVYLAILEEGQRVGFHIAGHPPLTVPAAVAASSGQRSFEHMVYAIGTGTSKFSANDSGPSLEESFFAPCWRADSVGDRACAALAATFIRHESYFTPTLSVWARGASDTVPLDAYKDVARADFWLLARLHRFGVPLLAGSDMPMAGASAEMAGSAARAIHGELGMLVAAGLTPLEALRTATLNPAKYWRATDSLGTVARGRLADLVILDADPLADIYNTSKIHAVVANGRYFDRAALDALAADVTNRLDEIQRQADAEDQRVRPE